MYGGGQELDLCFGPFWQVVGKVPTSIQGGMI